MHACQRDGAGGSPTAVLDETGQSDTERRAAPARLGTSHAVFVADDGDGRVSLRFFTSTGELPGCGHGTIAALALLGARGGREEFEVRTPGRMFTGWARRSEAGFDPGRVELGESGGHKRVLDALGLGSAPGARVATLGRPRLLVPVPSRAALAAVAPDFDRLRDACDESGLLGCYVYAVDSRVAARMFAPSIGVPEDIANANSTACLAAHLAGGGSSEITVDMGDALGSPATIRATAAHGEVRLSGAVTIGLEAPAK